MELNIDPISQWEEFKQYMATFNLSHRAATLTEGTEWKANRHSQTGDG